MKTTDHLNTQNFTAEPEDSTACKDCNIISQHVNSTLRKNKII